LITPVNNLKSIYGKFGYFTDKPKWFLGGKSYWIGSLSSIPSEIFNQNFGDELLESNSKKDPEEYKQYLIKTLPSIMRFLKNSVSGWTPSVEQMLDAIDIAYNVMKDTGDIKLAGKAFNDELNKLYKISQNNQDVSESSYKEGGSITHDGVKYDFDKVLAMAETKPTKQCPVSKLEWVLAYDEPDTTRLKNADISVPVVITKSNNGKLTVIDGLHRLAKAVDKNVNSLPVKYITNDELQSARLKQYVAEGSNQSYIFYRGEPILSSDRLKQLQASIGKPYPILRKEGSPSHIGTYMLPDRENAEGYVKQALAGKGKGGTVTKIEVDVNSFKNGDGGVDQAVIITNIAGLVSKQDPDPKDPLRINDRKKSMVYYLGPGVKKYLNDPYLNDPELVKKWYDPEFAKRMWDIIKSGKQAVTKPGENQIQERMIKILGPLAEKIRRDPEVINYFLRHSPNDWVERNFRMNSDGSGTKVIDVQYFPPVTKEGVAEDQSNDDLEIINKVESSFHNGYHGVLIAKTPERQVGYLSYSIYNDVPKIEMIYVAQDYRRHGVAKKMLKALQEISPNEEIDWGYTTDDGTNLKKSIDFIKKPNPEIIKKKAKLAGIQSKLARLNIKLEKLMDTNPELARRYVQTVGDRWNKLNDIEHRLKDELYSSKGEYSKFIPETEK
jgi:GNAT superfamily N-acetyltransferase